MERNDKLSGLEKMNSDSLGLGNEHYIASNSHINQDRTFCIFNCSSDNCPDCGCDSYGSSSCGDYSDPCSCNENPSTWS